MAWLGAAVLRFIVCSFVCGDCCCLYRVGVVAFVRFGMLLCAVSGYLFGMMGLV